jgi:hypothetical protein
MVRAPWQVGQGVSMTVPVPWHAAHGSENANDPSLRDVKPDPPQTGHWCAEVPGAAPLP